jgi:cytochrome c-type biogenesis protein CcsB
MAQLTTYLLGTAIIGYVLAMVSYAAEYTFGARGAVARTAVRVPRERERVLVGAGVGARDSQVTLSADDVVAPTVPPVSVPNDSGGRRALVVGRIALTVNVLAALAHGGVMVTRGIAAGRVPWGNMYEFVIALSFVASVAWLVLVAVRPSIRVLGLFVTLGLSLGLGLAATVLTTAAGPLVPALNSYWLKIHVSAAATASGLLLVAFVPAALFLVRTGYDRGKRSFPFSIGEKLPVADTLERLSFRMHAFAFPIWTFAIICGAIWAEAAWGRPWGWDPKEIWSFVSWVAYAAYLHARATPSVKRTVAAWFAVAAWITMLVNLYVINFVAVGLHSYAGVQ